MRYSSLIGRRHKPAGSGVPTQLRMTTEPPALPTNDVVFSPQPVVQVRAADGSAVAVAGVEVTVAVASGAGTLSGTLMVPTDINGRAAFTNLKLTGLVGVRTLSFSAPGLTGVTSAALSLLAGVPTQISASSATSQSATVSSNVGAPPSVLVRDAQGNPVQGVTVTFAVTAGGGSRSPATVQTNAAGIATLTSWTVGAGTGTNNNTLTATAAGLTGSPVTFTASGTAANTAHPNMPAGFDPVINERFLLPTGGQTFQQQNVNGWNALLSPDPAAYMDSGYQIVADPSDPTGGGTVMQFFSGTNGGVAYGGQSSLKWYKWLTAANFPIGSYPNRPNWRKQYVHVWFKIDADFWFFSNKMKFFCFSGPDHAYTSLIPVMSRLGGSAGVGDSPTFSIAVDTNQGWCAGKDVYGADRTSSFTINRGSGTGPVQHPRLQWISAEMLFEANSIVGGINLLDGGAKMWLSPTPGLGVGKELDFNALAFANPAYTNKFDGGNACLYMEYMRGGGQEVVPQRGSFRYANWYSAMGV